MPFYAASFVVRWEHRWFDPPTDPALARRSRWEPDGTYITDLQPARTELAWSLETVLFEGADAAAAFDWAVQRVDRHSDMIRGDMSDLTVMRCIGIHDIERIVLGGESLGSALRDDFGVNVATLTANDFGGDGWPPVRAREELSIFQPLVQLDRVQNADE